MREVIWEIITKKQLSPNCKVCVRIPQSLTGRRTPVEWTSITSWPNMARKSIGPLGTSIGTPLMNTVIVAGIRRQSANQSAQLASQFRIHSKIKLNCGISYQNYVQLLPTDDRINKWMRTSELRRLRFNAIQSLLYQYSLGRSSFSRFGSRFFLQTSLACMKI